MAVVLREADGISAEDARAIAAAKNIAEGTGNAVDAAKILRSRPDMGVDLPPTSALVRDAQGLASLSDDAFGMVINKKVPAGYAAIVGRIVEDERTHGQILDLLAKQEPASAIEAESMIRDVMDAPTVQATMEDMFGSSEVTQILFKERAQVLGSAAAAIRKDRAAFNVLVKEEARITGAGNQLNTKSNAERATQDAEILATLQATARRKGPVADALAAAAKQLADGAPRQVVVRDFLDALRGADAAANPDGGGAGPSRRSEQIAASLGGYRNTDQPAFKRWFGESKVVDENGEPLPVYHGTASDFTRFDPKKRGGFGGIIGFWFSSTPEGSEPFSRIVRGWSSGPQTIPVYLSLQNPKTYKGWDDHVEAVRAAKGDTIEDKYKSLRKQLEREGYDGIAVKNSDTDGGGVRDDFVAFSPTQIKSIFNRGTWDASDPNISFSKRQATPEEFRAYMARLSSEREAQQAEMLTALASEGQYSAITTNGRLVIATESLREPGLYQITNLDKDGEATGHIETTLDRLALDFRGMTGTGAKRTTPEMAFSKRAKQEGPSLLAWQSPEVIAEGQRVAAEIERIGKMPASEQLAAARAFNAALEKGADPAQNAPPLPPWRSAQPMPR